MPWDSTELRVAKLDDSGAAGVQTVCGDAKAKDGRAGTRSLGAFARSTYEGCILCFRQILDVRFVKNRTLASTSDSKILSP